MPSKKKPTAPAENGDFESLVTTVGQIHQQAQDFATKAVNVSLTLRNWFCCVPVGVPVIRGTNISDTRDLVGEMVYITPEKAEEVQSSIIFSDDLFFPHRGSIGLVGIVPRNGAPRYVQSSSMMKLTCDRSQVEPLYLFYFFRSALGRQELLKNASTVGTPGIGQPLSSTPTRRCLTLRSKRVYRQTNGRIGSCESPDWCRSSTSTRPTQSKRPTSCFGPKFANQSARISLFKIRCGASSKTTSRFWGASNLTISARCSTGRRSSSANRFAPGCMAVRTTRTTTFTSRLMTRWWTPTSKYSVRFSTIRATARITRW